VIAPALPPLVRFLTREIAFQSDRDGNSEIYSMKSDGTRQTRLTEDPAWDADPDFSPDGKKIAFTRYAGGNSDIYLMSAGGTKQKELVGDLLCHSRQQTYGTLSPGHCS